MTCSMDDSNNAIKLVVLEKASQCSVSSYITHHSQEILLDVTELFPAESVEQLDFASSMFQPEHK